MDLLKAQPPVKGVPLAEPSLLFPVIQSIWRPLSALTAIHERHGELVLARFFKQKILFVSRPEHVEQVYSQEAKGLLSRDFLYDPKKTLFGNGLVNSKSEVWTQQRRLMQPLFTKESVTVWEKAMVKDAAAAVLKLKTAATAEINLTDVMKSLVQRIFIKILMGHSVDDISNSADLMKAIDTINEGLLPQIVTQIISNGHLMRLMPHKKQRYQRAVDQLKTFVNQAIGQKHQAPGDDLISLFIKAKDNDTGYLMTDELLQDEVVNMFFAGQDTTINTLLWFFYLIGKNPDVHQRISEEISQGKHEPLTAAHLAKLSYTKAALYETLRLYPATTALATQAMDNIEIAERAIPKGTTIILSMYVTHRSPQLWERPNEFNPAHFIGASERHKYSFFPFGGGLHNCIGRHFAELEMLIIIVTLLRAFSFKTTINAKEAIGITLTPDQPITGTITPQ
jgi:cytochrome P450